jgi:hypothetical protein
MRYMVHIQIPLEAGNALDDPNGPGPGELIKHIVGRFKPESMYLSPARREIWMAVDFEKQAHIAELMLIATRKFGTYPEFIPVVTLQEFPEMIKESMAEAAKAPDSEKLLLKV